MRMRTVGSACAVFDGLQNSVKEQRKWRWIEKNKNITGLWRLVPFCLLMRIMVRMRVSVI